MPNTDQQQLYANATAVVDWLESQVPSPVAIRMLGAILVSIYQLSTECLEHLLTSNQTQSVDIAKKALDNGTQLHVPRVLSSASVEFQQAYSQDPPHQPDLTKISVDDARAKGSPWYHEESYSLEDYIYG
jgi:hypothetical protein